MKLMPRSIALRMMRTVSRSSRADAGVITAEADGRNFFAGAAERAHRHFAFRFRRPELRCGAGGDTRGGRQFHELTPGQMADQSQNVFVRSYIPRIG